MAEYNLGIARGRIVINYEGSGATTEAQKDLEAVGGAAEDTTGAVEDAGEASAVAGAVIAGGFAFAAKSAMDFEKQISAIGAVSGASTADLERLRAKALQLGADTSFGATAAAMAMEELAKAGISVEDILGGAADATVALAAAGAIELPAAAELAADAMNSFTLSARDLPHVVDLIAGAANSSSISVGDFGQSLKQVGAVANLVGVNFDDTAAAIALMGKMGIKGSDAGTSLKTMLMNLNPATKEQRNLMRELGIVTKDGANQFFDATGKAKSLSEISQVLQNSLKGMTEQQKLATLETLFGSDAIRAGAVLSKEGAAGFNQMADAMGKISAEEVAAERLNNTAGAMEQLKGSAETAYIAIGTILLPYITKLAKILTGAANWFTGLDQGTQKLLVNIGLIGAGLFLLFGAVTKVVEFVKAVRLFVLAVKAWTIWTRLAWMATNAWAVAQWILNAAFWANPITWIIIAIIALVAIIVLIATKTDWFQRLWKWAWTGIKKAAGAVADWFMKSVWPTMQKAWDGIVKGALWAWKYLKMAFDAIVSTVMSLVHGIMSVVNWFVPLFVSGFKLLVSIVKLVWSIISAIFAVWNTVMAAIFGPPLRALVALFSWAFGKIGDFIAYIWGIVYNSTKAVWGFIFGILSTIWNDVKRVSENVWGAIAKVITAVWDFVYKNSMAVWGAIFGFLSATWDSIKTSSSVVWNAISGAFEWVWENIKRIATAGRDRLIAIFDGIRAIVDKVRGFFNELKAAADGGTGTLIAFVKGIPGRILGAIGDLGSLLYNKGKELVQGLINGISNMIQTLRNKVSDLVGVVGRFLPGSPAKEGPLSGSGYVLKRGQRMVGDFAAGILRAGNKARDAIGSVMSGAAGSLPVGAGASVAGAQAGMASVQMTPTVASSSTASTRSVSIGQVSIQGVWDMANPDVPRQFVARLHEQLDRYEKEHR